MREYKGSSVVLAIEKYGFVKILTAILREKSPDV
jgi:hypothetical protein